VVRSLGFFKHGLRWADLHSLTLTAFVLTSGTKTASGAGMSEIQNRAEQHWNYDRRQEGRMQWRKLPGW